MMNGKLILKRVSANVILKKFILLISRPILQKTVFDYYILNFINTTFGKSIPFCYIRTNKAHPFLECLLFTGLDLSRLVSCHVTSHTWNTCHICTPVTPQMYI